MARSHICLILLGAALGYSAFWFGGAVAFHQNISAFAIAVAALLFWISRPPEEATPPAGRVLSWLALLLPLYVAFQLIPLPDALLRILSPARAELASGLAPVVADSGFAGLSVLPSATLSHLVRVCSCAVIFLLLRQLTWSRSERPWIFAAPIITLASFEAALGVVQHVGGHPVGPCRRPRRRVGCPQLRVPALRPAGESFRRDCFDRGDHGTGSAGTLERYLGADQRISAFRMRSRGIRAGHAEIQRVPSTGTNRLCSQRLPAVAGGTGRRRVPHRCRSRDHGAV